MSVDIVIPALGESITEGTILRWLKNAGEAVELDEIVVEIETDKATMELAAPENWGVERDSQTRPLKRSKIGESHWPA